MLALHDQHPRTRVSALHRLRLAGHLDHRLLHHTREELIELDYRVHGPGDDHFPLFFLIAGEDSARYSVGVNAFD